jgi:hypothetical protein
MRCDSVGDQPPFLGRLPGFFFVRVCEPRSRLTFWPRPAVKVVPAGAIGFGLALRSASVLILVAMVILWIVKAGRGLN